MTNIIFEIADYLKKEGFAQEAKAEAKMMVQAISGLSVEQILTGKEVKNREEIFAVAKKRIKTGAPIQYLLGFSYFMGEKFYVNSNVLIPRDETQFLVEKTLETVRKIKKPDGSVIQILDIGTGSGCIACMLAKLTKHLNVSVLAVDISTSALNVAIENMQKLNLINKVVFRKSDIYSNIKYYEKFDIIVSNPPYIPLKIKPSLQKEVKDFEPAGALFTNDSKGLLFYEKIISDAQKFLNPGGSLLFEMGMGQAKEINKLLEKYNFFAVETVKDLAGIERVIKAHIK